MQSSVTEIRCNSEWEKCKNSLVTVITPVYNRKSVLKRALDSVKRQTYDNFEYIIVNDGSTENLDDIVCEFMADVSFPVLYIKKENGGVHTARNIATENARGYYWINLDSDDEFFPTTLEFFVKKWNEISAYEQNNYFEIRACCVNQKGERIGKLYPEQGHMTVEMWNKKCRKLSFENISMRLTRVMKDNLFPEPEGIKFVPEFLLWKKLEKKYNSYFVNDIMRIVHWELIDGVDDHLSSNRNNSVRFVENACWKASYLINNWDDYNYYYGKMGYIDMVLKFCMYAHVMKKNNVEWKEYDFKEFFPRLLRRFFWIPGKILSWVYMRIRM